MAVSAIPAVYNPATLPTQFQMLNNRLQRRLFHRILIGVGSVALTVIFMYFWRSYVLKPSTKRSPQNTY